MTLIIAFGATLIVAVLLSERIHQTVLSTTVLFLGVGFLLGPSVTGWVQLKPTDPLVREFAQLALFSILFVEAMDFTVSELAGSWRLPSRALLLGLPLTVLLVALLGHWLLGLAHHEETHLGRLMVEVVGGIAIGVAVPWLSLRMARWSFFGVLPKVAPLSVVYALLAYESVPHGDRLFQLVALVTAASMVAHSSTDVLVARTFREEEQHRPPEDEAAGSRR